MLVVTALSAKRNHSFETKFEFWGLFLASLALLFIVPATAFPVNAGLALVFAFLIGSLIGPGIKGMMLAYITRKTLQRQGFHKKQLREMSTSDREAKMAEVRTSIEHGPEHPIVNDWNRIFQLAVYSTTVITIIAGTIVYALDYDFSFLGKFLLVALLGLIVVGLFNIFFTKSPLVRLISAYVGAVIFSLYLLFDFDQLEKAAAAGETSWEAAVSFAISIYLDIVNLFLDLLQILSAGD